MKFILIIIFFILASTKSYACDINFLKFGSSPLNFPLDAKTKVKKLSNDIVIITTPINLFCNKSELNGTNVDFLFIKNQLVKIKIFRENFQNNLLLDLVVNKYGDFKRTLGLEKDNWRGTQGFENKQEYAAYVSVINNDYRIEIIEIVSKNLSDLMTIYSQFQDNEK
jgi:hypothetical protein